MSTIEKIKWHWSKIFLRCLEKITKLRRKHRGSAQIEILTGPFKGFTISHNFNTSHFKRVYYYSPSDKFSLNRDQLYELLWALEMRDLDFLQLLPFSQENTFKLSEDLCIWKKKFKTFQNVIKELQSTTLVGRWIKTHSQDIKPIYSVGKPVSHKPAVDGFCGISAPHKQPKLSYFTKYFGPTPYLPESILLTKHEYLKNVVVLPTYLAVGGVEKNTQLIIKELSSSLQFIVIPTARAIASQGSLRDDFESSGALVFDFSELIAQQDLLAALERISQSIPVNNIWICNGSHWLCERRNQLRNIFSSSKIIDQEVYDTSIGWVETFHDKALFSFNFIVAINSKIKETLIEKFKFKKEQIRLIYPAFNSEKIQPSSKLNKTLTPTLCFIGRMSFQKNPDKLLDIAKQISKKNVSCKFLMVGDGELANHIDKRIESENISNVKRLPFTSNVSEVFSQSDALILTSRFEGLPIVTLEAIAHGVPIFASNVGDIDQLLSEFPCGVIWNESKTAVEVCDLFIEYLKNIPVYKSAAAQYRMGVINKFSSQTIAKQYLELFQ